MVEIEQGIRKFIVDNLLLGQEDRLLAGSESLLEAGIIDSTGVLELVAFLEESYGIEVSDDEMVPDNLDSLDNLVRYVSKKRAV